MKHDLDEELISSLDEALPPASSLSAGALRKHNPEIRRQDRLFSAGENRLRRVSLLLYRVLSVLAAAGIIAALLWGVTDLPRFGSAANPTGNEVARRYLESGLREGGSTNLVANMILDYRAFDTLGESSVLFTASCAVLLLLRKTGDGSRKPLAASDPAGAIPADPVLAAGAAVLFPVILLFGVYIILNGHLGPGGGFSGGAVLAAGLILYRSAFGARRAAAVLSFRRFQWISFSALLFYTLSKAWSFLTGANHLPASLPLGAPGAILSGGLILPLNIAVGLLVCCTLYGFFALFEKGSI